MTQVHTLHPARLLRLAALVSTEESRPSLHGVYFAPDGSMVATNGHVMGIYARSHNCPSGSYEVSKNAARFLAKIVKTAKLLGFEEDEALTEANVALPVTHEVGKGINVAWNGASVFLPEIKGPYPNYLLICPRDEPSPVSGIAYSQKVLAKFGKDARLFFTFYQYNKAAVVRLMNKYGRFLTDFYGLIMPLGLDRYREQDFYNPVAEPVSEEKKGAVAA